MSTERQHRGHDADRDPHHRDLPGPITEEEEAVEESDREKAGVLSDMLVQRYLQNRGRSEVQRDSAAGSEEDCAEIQHHAAAGVAGAGVALPHLDRIQASFGRHDVSAIGAHVGGDAAAAADAIGAEAYATGDQVAFRTAPDLHTAAHEAAHVVQQRAGVQLEGGVGEVGDVYEQQADEVADVVSRGESAEPLLDEALEHDALAGRGPEHPARITRQGGAVQMRGSGGRASASIPYEVALDVLKSAGDLAATRNRTGDLSPDGIVAPAELVGAMWNLWHARTGTAAECSASDDPLAGQLGEQERLDYLRSARTSLRAAVEAVQDGAQDKKQAAAWIDRSYRAPLARLERDITVGTFQEVAWVAARVVEILKRTTHHWETRPDRIELKHPRYLGLLWKFWSATNGLLEGSDKSTRGGDLDYNERFDLLEEAESEIGPCLSILRDESTDKTWVDTRYVPAVAHARQVIAWDEANRNVNQIDRIGRDLRDGDESEPNADERTQVLAATFEGQKALGQVRSLITAYTRIRGGDMEKALKESLTKLNSDFRNVNAVKDMPVTQALTHLGGLLSGVQAVYSIRDAADRKSKAQELNLVAEFANFKMAVTGILAGVMSATTLFAGGIATLAGNTAAASQLFALGSRSVRVLGQVTGAFQLVYGVAVLLDPNSSVAARRAAVMHVGLGAGGTAGLLNTLGVWKNAAGGPLTIGVLVTALQVKFLRSAVSGSQKGWANGTVGQAYRNIEPLAEDIRDTSSRLLIALTLAHAQPPTDERELAVHEGYQMVARSKAQAVKRSVGLLLRSTVNPQRKSSIWETWQHPGNYEQIRSKYRPLVADYERAESPEEIGQLAATVLHRTVEVFDGFHDHVCDFLTNVHRDSILLGGMHDDICPPEE